MPPSPPSHLHVVVLDDSPDARQQRDRAAVAITVIGVPLLLEEQSTPGRRVYQVAKVKGMLGKPGLVVLWTDREPWLAAYTCPSASGVCRHAAAAVLRVGERMLVPRSLLERYIGGDPNPQPRLRVV